MESQVLSQGDAAVTLGVGSGMLMQGENTIILGHQSGVENLPPDSVLLGSGLEILKGGIGKNVLIGNRVSLNGGESSVVISSPHSTRKIKTIKSVCIGETIEKCHRSVSIVNMEERGFVNDFRDSVVVGRIDCQRDKPSRVVDKSVVLNGGVMCSSSGSVVVGYRSLEGDISGCVLLGRGKSSGLEDVVLVGNDVPFTREGVIALVAGKRGEAGEAGEPYLAVTTSLLYRGYSLCIGLVEPMDIRKVSMALGLPTGNSVESNALLGSGVLLRERENLIHIGNLNKLRPDQPSNGVILIGNLVPFTLNASIAIVHPLNIQGFIASLPRHLPVYRSIVISAMLSPLENTRDSIVIGHSLDLPTSVSASILIGNLQKGSTPVSNSITIGNSNTPRSNSIILGKANASLASGLVFNTPFRPRRWARPESELIKLEMTFNPKLEWQCGGAYGKYSNEVPDSPACEGKVLQGTTTSIQATYAHRRTVKVKTLADLTLFPSVIRVGAPTEPALWTQDVNGVSEIGFERFPVDDLNSGYTPSVEPGIPSTGPLYYREEHYIRKTIKLLPVFVNGKKYFIPIVYRVLTELLIVRTPSPEERTHKGAERFTEEQRDGSTRTYLVRDVVGAASGTFIPFTRTSSNKLIPYRPSGEPTAVLETRQLPVQGFTIRGQGITVLPTEARVDF